MSIMYEAFWHAIIVGPVLIFIAMLDLLTALVETCSDRFDRFAGEAEVASDPIGVERCES